MKKNLQDLSPEELIEKWISETKSCSIIGKSYSHPAYLELMELGKINPKKVITSILKELRIRPNHWFYALRTLSKENPAETMRTFDEKVQSWLEWGVEKGYLE